jgi:hypothetical protein
MGFGEPVRRDLAAMGVDFFRDNDGEREKLCTWLTHAHTHNARPRGGVGSSGDVQVEDVSLTCCGSTFYGVQAFQEHHAMTHTLQCSVCDKSFAHPHYLGTRPPHYKLHVCVCVYAPVSVNLYFYIYVCVLAPDLHLIERHDATHAVQREKGVTGLFACLVVGCKVRSCTCVCVCVCVCSYDSAFEYTQTGCIGQQESAHGPSELGSRVPEQLCV